MQQSPGCLTPPIDMNLFQQQRHEPDQRINQRQPAEDARTDRKADGKPDDQDGARRRMWIFLG